MANWAFEVAAHHSVNRGSACFIFWEALKSGLCSILSAEVFAQVFMPSMTVKCASLPQDSRRGRGRGRGCRKALSRGRVAARPGAGRTGLPGKSPRRAKRKETRPRSRFTIGAIVEVAVDGPVRQPFAGALCGTGPPLFSAWQRRGRLHGALREQCRVRCARPWALGGRFPDSDLWSRIKPMALMVFCNILWTLASLHHYDSSDASSAGPLALALTFAQNWPIRTSTPKSFACSLV